MQEQTFYAPLEKGKKDRDKNSEKEHSRYEKQTQIVKQMFPRKKPDRPKRYKN